MAIIGRCLSFKLLLTRFLDVEKILIQTEQIKIAFKDNPDK